MIECSGCLTWLHMSCAKVKRKNIPEFYYCDNCKSSGGIVIPSNTSSGEEAITPNNNGQNGTISSNSIIADGFLSNSTQQNQNSMITVVGTAATVTTTASVKSRKPKMAKKPLPSSLMMMMSDNINSVSDSKYFNKTTVSGKLKKLKRKTISPSKRITKAEKDQANAISSSSLAAAASLTALSLNHHNNAHHQIITTNGGIQSIPSENLNLLKSPIATNNNNNIYSNQIVIQTPNTARTENGSSSNDGPEKYNKRMKLL